MKLRLLVKGKELLYIVVALIIGIVIGTMIVIKSYNYNCLGTVADWMSAIMSFVAILVVFWQVKRESQNEKAFYIENKRPRFSVERTTVINSNEKILYHNSYGNLKTLYKKLHDEEHPRYIIRLTNISDSIVHSLKIILKYNSEELNGYAFSGLTSKQSLLLVPDEELSNGGFIDLQVEFETAANETGYFCFKVDLAGDFTEYIFVKDEEPVTVYGKDILVDKNSNETKELEKRFKGKKYSYKSITIAPEEFRTMKK